MACLAMVRAAPEAGAMIGCDECVHEMRKMGDIIRHHAPGLEVGIACFKENVMKGHTYHSIPRREFVRVTVPLLTRSCWRTVRSTWPTATWACST